MLPIRIENLKWLAPDKAALLNTELGIFTYGDIIRHYPIRYEDKNTLQTIANLNGSSPSSLIQLHITSMHFAGVGRAKRLIVQATDGTGNIELVWFSFVESIQKKLSGKSVIYAFGKPSEFNGKLSISHPEIEFTPPPGLLNSALRVLTPVYSQTEKLKKKYLDSKFFAKAVGEILSSNYQNITDPIPVNVRLDYQLIDRLIALKQIHFPTSDQELEAALKRLKFEELFISQIKILGQKISHKIDFDGFIFNSGALLNNFYTHHLPFPLTNAQKRVVKEIYADCRTGKQMNRLLQGDVGSGKTIVAFLTALIAIDSGYQVVLMAPTEILADQHFIGLSEYANAIGMTIAKLTGSVKKKDRKFIFEGLESGDIKLLVGTHAVIEDTVAFVNLGLTIIDEQHRFGVAQRARLWKKSKIHPPHVLVMTATPIPRTLAMTVYGDLDVSIIDELPPGRKIIKTDHCFEANRLVLQQFLRSEIALGRQIYVVFPLIEESETLNYKNLMLGVEHYMHDFPQPQYQISVVHGQLKKEDKDYEMERFRSGEANFLLATTVIEVGVNIPNASVMVIESAEKFGLSQLHQLRGRVGRGNAQSYCKLVTEYNLGKDAKTRMKTMVETSNGFEIAEVDLKLRGPGDLLGTKQSGLLDLKLADLAKDATLLTYARNAAKAILESDPNLELQQHQSLRLEIQGNQNGEDGKLTWSKIS